MCFCLNFLKNYAKTHLDKKINETVFRAGIILATMGTIFVKKANLYNLFQIVQYSNPYMNNEYNLCNF